MPFAVLLAVLPYPGTVALRLLSLAVAFSLAVVIWRQEALRVWPVRWAFAPWILLSIASLGYAVDFQYSLGELKNELGYTMMAFFAFLAVSADRRRAVWLLAVPLISLGMLSAWALGATLIEGRWPQGGGHGGTGSFATHLIIVLPCLVSVLVLHEGSRLRAVCMACTLVCLLAAAVSQQRIIWTVLAIQGATAVTLLFLGERGTLRDRRRMIWILGVLTAAGVLATILAHTVKYGVDAFGAYAVGADPRALQWPQIMQRIVESWPTGAGFGRNAMKLAHPDLIPADAPLLWHAHNTLLNYGLAVGLPGMLAFALLAGALVCSFSKLALASPAPQYLISVAGAMLVTGMLARNLTNDFFLRDGALMFWSITGLLYGLARRLTACQ